MNIHRNMCRDMCQKLHKAIYAGGLVHPSSKHPFSNRGILRICKINSIIWLQITGKCCAVLGLHGFKSAPAEKLAHPLHNLINRQINYHLLITKAFSAAFCSASCFDLPSPVAICTSPRKTASVNFLS